MPKGVIRSYNKSNEVALWRVEDEAGIHAEIIGIAGNTRYDFFSESRGKANSGAASGQQYDLIQVHSRFPALMDAFSLFYRQQGQK